MLTTELPGRIEPARTAEVRARVPGIVLERLFTEGADVKAGDVLFRIDPQPLEAAVAEARGALAQAEANLFQASSVARRYEGLVESRAISQQQYDNAIAARKSAEAEKLSAEAALKTAELNLGCATVTAPIDGRIGRALVTEGALVGQGEATPMARIQQLDPIYADFTQSVDELLRLRAAVAEGRIRQDDDGAAKVRITLGKQGYSQEGRLLFSDVSVDPSTGQVVLRAELPNPDAVLLPGMYVRVQTEVGMEASAIFVPQRAIVRGTDSIARVLVVDRENRVQQREVELGAMRGRDWQVTAGLEQGEQVIVDAVHKFQPGDQVEPVTAN
ncbi:resistance-nodulation-cell division (RND) multidrug efflux membrane fusion protein MexC [Halopseudomonas pertucinogena]|uniref:Resistance-nodulation-cell division (RND) multidrug efflux membrane fusion protein MexC n=2 Tax=Halopseudomonas pertucinogena TaxID=86175 RepID=A0ABQ2CPG4_9GAMM|nr:resistance-nodulation-cell division (RND) multidrug efflux membrane fusion protein MexC [Halopseudomonas pertucinogena]